MNPQEIRSWLLQAPKPDALRVTGPDDQVHDVAITRGGSWARLAESIAALRPELIEAYDAGGKLLRAVRPAEHEAAHDTIVPPSMGSSSSSSSTGMLGMGDLSILLREFGKELSLAYRHANEVAFTRMVDMFEAVNRRSETLEKSLDATHKMLRRAWEDQLEAQAAAAAAEVESQKDPLNAIVGSFVQGAAAAAATPKPNGNGAHGATNGKA